MTACQCLCLFSTFPKTKKTASRQIELCRRLTVEFMHYVIASKSLRKVLLSKLFLCQFTELQTSYVCRGKQKIYNFHFAITEINSELTWKTIFQVFISIKGIYYQAEIMGSNCNMGHASQIWLWSKFSRYVVIFHYFQYLLFRLFVHMLHLTFVCMLQPPTEVDFKIMSTFVEFYTTMMGFINYKLYSTINLFYPPKVSWHMHVG